MKGSTFGHQFFGLLLGLCLVSSLPHFSSASSNDPLSASLASDLVQSRAQISILRHDDQIDVGCQSRRFVGSRVVNQPRVVNQKLNERKWLERWSLNRCGREMHYHVYFTVVGDGGAFFSFREVESSSFREVASSPSYLARTLRLHQPKMRGSDVRALQVALMKKGFDVSTDGVFGPKTRDAVKAYQKQNGLAADGIAGPATSARLGL